VASPGRLGSRPLGSSGLRVSRLGLGLAALGRPAYINLGRDQDLGPDRSVRSMQRRCHEVLDTAWDAGVRYLDAARSYGLAESFLARWLASRPDAAEAVVGSKWGYSYTGGWRLDASVHEVKDHSAAALRRQLAETLATLGPRLSLYQIHSVTPDSPVLGDPEVLGELARLRERGLAVGLSVSGEGQAEVIDAVVAAGQGPFQVVQATWNLLEPSAGPALQRARQAGLGVIVKEALANGRLAGRGACPEPLAQVAARHQVGPDAVALAAALAQPFADVVLSGAATPAQLASNLAATGLHLDASDTACLAGLATDPASYWAERRRLPWR
jgi:aryl-alcohol dehydrogenase-like predicted oxidoreductase